MKDIERHSTITPSETISEGIVEKRKLPFCSIIVINYNGKDLLAKFLPSIANLDYENYEVIVVDNASTDYSVSFVKMNYPNFKIVINSQNYGTAQGSNSGIPYAKGEYILFISNDMLLEPPMLRLMIELAESSPGIGICTCKMRRITSGGKRLNVIDSVGGDVDVFGFPSARGINEPDRGQLDEVCEVFFSFGGAMLIKRKVLEEIGGYDPLFFTLADDIDLCWRARLAGYKVVVQPKAVLYHMGSATLGTIVGRSRKRYWSERNTLRMLIKNYSISSLMKIIPIYLGLLIFELIFFLFLRKPLMALAALKAILWNISYFRNTWTEHIKAQSLRKLSDKDIQKLMYKKPFKIVKIFKEYLYGIGDIKTGAYFGGST